MGDDSDGLRRIVDGESQIRAMPDGDRDRPNEYWRDPPGPNWGRIFGGAAALFAIIVIVALVIYFWDDIAGPHRPSDYSPGYANSEPPPYGSGAPGSSSMASPGVEIPSDDSVRDRRRAAWQEDDFYSQLQLGAYYSPHDANAKARDPIEAYVWYFLAFRSGHPESDVEQPGDSTWDAYRRDAMDIFSKLTVEERLEVRRRIIYILASRGGPGFVTLGWLHEEDLTDNRVEVDRCEDPGPDNPYPWTDPRNAIRCQSTNPVNVYNCSQPSSSWRWERENSSALECLIVPDSPSPLPSPIIPSDTDALMYYYIAKDKGYPPAARDVASLQSRVSSGVDSVARAASQHWSPEYEYYPGETQSGVWHTDEYIEDKDRRDALRYTDCFITPQKCIDPRSVATAFAVLNYPKPADANCVRLFQRDLQDQTNGILTPRERVRLVQMAAVAGNAESQIELGTMYAKGFGVPGNADRAKFWFTRAAGQRGASALFDRAVLESSGPQADKYKADSDFAAAAAKRAFGQRRRPPGPPPAGDPH